jgi:lysophospholipase L1-like esterase
VDGLTTSLAEKVYNEFNGKRMVFLGDSFTDQGRYTTPLTSMLQATSYNGGCSGCFLTNQTSQTNYNLFSGVKLVDAIVNNNFSAQVATGLFSQRVATLQSIDFSTIDIVTIAYGTNDYTSNVSIGNDSDSDGTTIKGAINYITKTLLQKYPNLKIVFITPIYRDSAAQQTTSDGKNCDDNPNSGGYFLRQYVEAIKYQSAKNHVKCIDVFHNSGINRYSQASLLLDGIHPTDAGGQVLANLIYRGLITQSLQSESYGTKEDLLTFQKNDFGNLIQDSEDLDYHYPFNKVTTINGLKYLTTTGSTLSIIKSTGYKVRSGSAYRVTGKMLSDFTGNQRLSFDYYYKVPAGTYTDINEVNTYITTTANVETSFDITITIPNETNPEKVLQSELFFRMMGGTFIAVRDIDVQRVSMNDTYQAFSPTLPSGFTQFGGSPLKYKYISPNTVHIKGSITGPYNLIGSNAHLLDNLPFTISNSYFSYIHSYNSDGTGKPVQILYANPNFIALSKTAMYNAGDTVQFDFDNIVGLA